MNYARLATYAARVSDAERIGGLEDTQDKVTRAVTTLSAGNYLRRSIQKLGDSSQLLERRPAALSDTVVEDAIVALLEDLRQLADQKDLDFIELVEMSLASYGEELNEDD
jgi:hypothetical protein